MHAQGHYHVTANSEKLTIYQQTFLNYAMFIQWNLLKLLKILFTTFNWKNLHYNVIL